MGHGAWSQCCQFLQFFPIFFPPYLVFSRVIQPGCHITIFYKQSRETERTRKEGASRWGQLLLPGKQRQEGRTQSRGGSGWPRTRISPQEGRGAIGKSCPGVLGPAPPEGGGRTTFPSVPRAGGSGAGPGTRRRRRRWAVGAAGWPGRAVRGFWAETRDGAEGSGRSPGVCCRSTASAPRAGLTPGRPETPGGGRPLWGCPVGPAWPGTGLILRDRRSWPEGSSSNFPSPS